MFFLSLIQDGQKRIRFFHRSNSSKEAFRRITAQPQTRQQEGIGQESPGAIGRGFMVYTPNESLRDDG